LTIQNRLFELQDKEYAAFQSKLIPTLTKDKIIGVRIPEARKLAMQVIKDGLAIAFLEDLPHAFYDENILHSLLISEIKDYSECIRQVDVFLPYVDNWAVCDIISPKVFKKNRQELIGKIKEWSSARQTYTCRFGLGILMCHYLDQDFVEEYLEIPALVQSDDYYVKMMVAWFFATALSKQWDTALPYLIKNKLDPWTHNKTIQKARESFRITKEQKIYLKELKR
jgi:3-methyladenine DNA glycosylase AlkD